MSRLDNIIARNQRANTGMRRGKLDVETSADAGPKVEIDLRTGEPKLPPGERLDRILARNRRGSGSYRWIKVGLAGFVLFVVLILLIFTDLADPPPAAYPEPSPAQLEQGKGVGGVKLWKQPTKKTGSGSAERSQ